jgi:hypothetical protein
LLKKDTALREKQAKKGSQTNKIHAKKKATRAKKSTQLPKHQIRNTTVTAALKATKMSLKAAASTAKKSSLWNLWSTKKSDRTQEKIEGQKPKSKKPAAPTRRERPSAAKKSEKIKNGNDKSNRQLKALGEVMDAIEQFKMHAEKLGISGKELLDAVSEASLASELPPTGGPPCLSSSSLSSLSHTIL